MSEQFQNQDAETFLTLLNENERSLAAYVHTLVPSPADADDILQASRITLWKNFSDFEAGTNFLAWARKIAFHQVLNFRRSEKRSPQFSTDPEFIESIAREIDRNSDRLDARSEALHQCLRKLPKAHRRTVLLRYYEDCDIEQIAEKTGRTEGAVYRLLSRIRSVLNDCVTRTLSQSAT